MGIQFFVLTSILCLSCSSDEKISPSQYCRGFSKLSHDIDNDLENIWKQFDKMGYQIKSTGKMDDASHESGTRAIHDLQVKLTKLTDSLTTVEPYKGDKSVRERAVRLVKQYHDNVLPAYEAFNANHYIIYGKQEILKMNNERQDSLNQFIIIAHQKMINAIHLQMKESDEFRSFLIEWRNTYNDAQAARKKSL